MPLSEPAKSKAHRSDGKCPLSVMAEQALPYVYTRPEKAPLTRREASRMVSEAESAGFASLLRAL